MYPTKEISNVQFTYNFELLDVQCFDQFLIGLKRGKPIRKSELDKMINLVKKQQVKTNINTCVVGKLFGSVQTLKGLTYLQTHFHLSKTMYNSIYEAITK